MSENIFWCIFFSFPMIDPLTLIERERVWRRVKFNENICRRFIIFREQQEKTSEQLDMIDLKQFDGHRLKMLENNNSFND
jgi:hypothetical protein